MVVLGEEEEEEDTGKRNAFLVRIKSLSSLQKNENMQLAYTFYGDSGSACAPLTSRI